jgi:hypothetical protein
MVVVNRVTERQALLHHEKPVFPISKRAKVELKGYGPNGMKLTESHFFSTVRGIHAFGSLLATRSTWIEPHAVTRWPKLACRDPDHAETHAKH